MKLIEKLEPIILIAAIIIGLIFTNIKFLSENMGNLINIFLCLMLYGLFLEIPLKEFADDFRSQFRAMSNIPNQIGELIKAQA